LNKYCLFHCHKSALPKDLMIVATYGVVVWKCCPRCLCFVCFVIVCLYCL